MTLVARVFGILTLIALGITGAIPQGWMPAQGNDGKVLLVLCTGEGTVEQWVDRNPDEEPLHDETDQRTLCPFAGLTADADVPPLGLPISIDLPIQPRWTHADFTHRSVGFHARYDALAPPYLS